MVGKMNAPPMPMSPRATISMSGEVERDASAENVPNRTSPMVSALAPEAVAERAGGEQQAGEHDRVGVDDPLQLRALGAEVSTIDGSATLRIVLSMLMTISERHSTASVHQRR